MSIEKNYLVNFSKKLIIDPSDLTFSATSSFRDIALVDEELGNPFQYEFFNLLKNEWKADRIGFSSDRCDTLDYLLNEKVFKFDLRFKDKYFRMEAAPLSKMMNTIHPSEFTKIRKKWEAFINEFILINYDRGYFMTLDRRLLRLNGGLMPYFHFAQAKNAPYQTNSWVGDAIGLETIESRVVESVNYIEMYRMAGEITLCELLEDDAEKTYTETWV